MPRYYRRRTTRRSRRDSALPLVILLVLAVLLLLLLTNGRSLLAFLPPLPNITIPITGLPQIQVPTIQIPLTLEPGTLMPNIGIGGTPIPVTLVPGTTFGLRTKTTGCQVQGALPDPACTPGAVFNVTAEQICTSGYAASVRNVTDSVRDQVYTDYGIVNRSPSQYEVDHLIPLALGGSNDIANLWPQAVGVQPGANEKDRLETYLQEQVCSGKLSLADAQRQIASNWVTVYNQMPK